MILYCCYRHDVEVESKAALQLHMNGRTDCDIYTKEKQTAEEKRKTKLKLEVYRIADQYLEALYEALDRMDKRHDATATEIIAALREGGYDDEADGYEDWLIEGMAGEERPRTGVQPNAVPEPKTDSG
jgi:hypothetical protein